MAERIRALWQRLVADIHRNPGLWIGVGISAAVLVVAYLAYRKSQSASQAQVPANGYGIPDYGAASGGSSSGGLLSGLGYNPIQPASPAAPVTYTPTSLYSPATAAPAFPSFPAFTLPGATASSPDIAPAASIGTWGRAVGGIALARSMQVHYSTILPPWLPASPLMGAIQNPLAAAQLDHRGLTQPTSFTSPTLAGVLNGPQLPFLSPTLGAVQNPSAASDAAHRGYVGAIPPQQTSIQTPHINSMSPQFIPTTVRPLPTVGRGRVA